MARRLEEQIHQRRPFESPAEESYLNLQRSAGLLLQSLAQLLRSEGPGAGLSPVQYNALRILRGAHPDSLPCGEVGARLVTPGPDVTRLLDRLDARGLTSRERDLEDRRVVRARITEEGLAALAAVDEPLRGWLDATLGHLSEEEHRTLSTLLEVARNRLE
ncbi:MAG: MarR family transcriptional regulator [Acidobacteriota bacterium]